MLILKMQKQGKKNPIKKQKTKHGTNNSIQSNFIYIK